MILAGILATAAVGTFSSAAYYFIIKEDKMRMEKSLRAYLEEPSLNFTYKKHGKQYILTPPNLEELTKVKLRETDTTITCVFYLQFLQDLIPIYSFKYDKERSTYYDVREECFFSPNKGKKITNLLEKFNEFIVFGAWKEKIDLNEEPVHKEEKQPQVIYKKVNETDPDIRYHLQEIETKIQWLQQTGSLEIEEEHKIEVLKTDAERILHSYHNFREETKMAFKEKVIEALLEIKTKLNELSIKKEQQIINDMDKTITLIKKR